MSVNNPLRKFVDKAMQYPAWLGPRLITWVFRWKVKLAGTVALDILETDGKRAVFRQKNKRKAQNHIGTVHAAAMALLAESATGFIVGINLPSNKLPLLKTMNLKYVKRSTGVITAVASLTDEQINKLMTEPKGDIEVKVQVTDETGIVPMEAEMVWAWVEKSRK